MIIVILVILGLVLVLFLINFYRDPNRTHSPDSVCISPADGKVILISTLEKLKGTIPKGLLGSFPAIKGISPQSNVISIFMSPLDVHINRMPLDGKILSVKHYSGKFSYAKATHSWIENERSEIIIDTTYGKIVLYQIAGFLARRVQPWVHAGDAIKKGERIGRIVLGSQVTLILPRTLKPSVTLGQQVYAGTTAIAGVK